MSRWRSVAGYTVLRLALFVVPFLIVWLLGGNATIAAVVAAIAGVCLSVIFLPRQRAAMAGAIERRSEERTERRRADPGSMTDEDAEDAVVDDTRQDGARQDDAHR